MDGLPRESLPFEGIVDASKTVSGGQTDHRHVRRGIARAAGVLSSLTLASRVAGLARDVAVGAVFGASASADAFFVAFRIPNLFRRIVAEGAASSAFVPVFSGELARGGPAEAAAASRAVARAAATSLALLVVLGVVYAEFVVDLFAPGFGADAAKRELTIELARGTFPYLFLVGMAAWAMGTLHTFQRFVAPAVGPILFNLAIVASVLALPARLGEPVQALVIGVLAGGVLQLLVQVPSLRKIGVIGLRSAVVTSREAVRKVGRLLVPTIFGGAVYQINILVATIFASLLPDRSVSYLWYADRVFEFPLGIVAVAIGTAALPALSRQVASGRYDEMAHGVAYSLKLAWAVCLPAMVGLWVLAPQIVEVLFERGKFSALDTEMTAWALRTYSVGLLSVAAVRVLVSVFYAFEEPRVPVLTASAAFVVNVIADLALMGPTNPDAEWWGAAWILSAGEWLRIADLRHAGLALGTGIAATVNAVLLYVLARRRLPALRDEKLGKSILAHAVAAGAMALLLLAWLGAGRLWLEGRALAWVSVVGAIPLAGIVYVVVAIRLGSEEVGEIGEGICRRLKPSA